MLREWLWVRGDRVFSMVLTLTAVADCQGSCQ